MPALLLGERGVLPWATLNRRSRRRKGRERQRGGSPALGRRAIGVAVELPVARPQPPLLAQVVQEKIQRGRRDGRGREVRVRRQEADRELACERGRQLLPEERLERPVEVVDH